MRIAYFGLLMLLFPTIGDAENLKLICEFGQGKPVLAKQISEDWENIRMGSAVFAIELDLEEDKAYSDWFSAKNMTGAGAWSDDNEIMWFLDMAAGMGYTFRLNRHTGSLFVLLSGGGYYWAANGKCVKPKALF